jgi:hypothetical protein
MKKAVLFVVLGVLLVTAPLNAQISDETILTYQVLTEKWAGLIGGVLELSETEAAEFWPLYKEYSSAKGALWNERIDVIKMYLAGYETMGPETARGLLGTSFEIDEKMLSLERKWAERFDDVLPPAKVVRLFQAENKLETMMLMEIARDIPLAR